MIVNVNTRYLTPSQLAMLAALTSQAAVEMFDTADFRHYDMMVRCATVARDELIANAGDEDALQMLQDAGADPDILFNGEPYEQHDLRASKHAGGRDDAGNGNAVGS